MAISLSHNGLRNSWFNLFFDQRAEWVSDYLYHITTKRLWNTYKYLLNIYQLHYIQSIFHYYNNKNHFPVNI